MISEISLRIARGSVYPNYSDPITGISLEVEQFIGQTSNIQLDYEARLPSR
jgi:hypothetical protein